MFNRLKPLFSLQFLKFCTVGASGVVVNLGILALLSDGFGIQINIASAVAIEISINSNFFINELWTFRDHNDDSGIKGFSKRWLQFHAVSIVGGIVQWTIFIAVNMCWLLMLEGGTAVGEYSAMGADWLDHYILGPIAHPPDVDNLKYLSQLFGIGIATLWNYFANFYWTWKQKTPESKDG
ncbi:MAG: GtrA family protein [Proteobacteria bacterium]|nr:GtrA family protein [Pseudomonadota bacterium]